jgi:hypothetical protein
MTEKEEMRLKTRNDYQKVKVKSTAVNGLVQDEEAKRLALEAVRKFQEEHHPRRVSIRPVVWNGKVLPPVK